MNIVNYVIELKLEGFSGRYDINGLGGNINLEMKLPVQAEGIAHMK